MSKKIEVSSLFEDEHVLAVEKPAGYETVVKGGSGGRCLTARLRRTRGYSYIQPCHRLDRDTTGIQLFALSESGLKGIEEQFRERRVEKQYLAFCKGVPGNPEGVIRRSLSKWGGGRRAVRVIKGRGGLTAETGYRLIAFSPPLGENLTPALPCLCSLLLFEPQQGRTHQVRVHASALGHPILGDDQYGNRHANRDIKNLTGLKRQALHAWRIRFSHPVTHQPVSLEAPMLEDMVSALDACIPDWRVALGAVPW